MCDWRPYSRERLAMHNGGVLISRLNERFVVRKFDLCCGFIAIDIVPCV